MNKNSINKVYLFLTSIENRIKENKYFFKRINVSLNSGNKKYKMEFINDNNKINKLYNGERQEVLDYEIKQNIKDCLHLYDAVEIEYIERGEKIVINADDKNVKMNNFKMEDDIKDIKFNNTQREFFIKPFKASQLLKELGIMSKESKIKNDKIRKYKQIDHMVELINDILSQISQQKKVINIIDCACGKSYLSFVLNFYIKEELRKNCRFVCIDISEDVIKKSKHIAKKLDYNNMDFICMDIRDFDKEKSSFKGQDIDLLISLHACDIATDYAISLGIKQNVNAMIIVPCCHKEMLTQYSFKELYPITKHGIFKARLADVLTDGMRCLFMESYGYDVSVVEFVSPLETPKNLMIRAQKETKHNEDKEKEYQELKRLFGVCLTHEKELQSHIKF